MSAPSSRTRETVGVGCLVVMHQSYALHVRAVGVDFQHGKRRLHKRPSTRHHEGMTTSPPRKPGDFILDRYMPDADETAREQARENLRRFARALLRIAMRQTRAELAMLDSRNSAKGARISKAR